MTFISNQVRKILEVENGAFFTSRRFVRKIREPPAFLPSFSYISGARAVCWGGVRAVATVSTASALRKCQASGNTDVQIPLTSPAYAEKSLGEANVRTRLAKRFDFTTVMLAW